MKKILILTSFLSLTALYTLPCFATECSQELPTEIIDENLKQITETAIAPYLQTPFVCKLDNNFSIVLEFKSDTYKQFYMEAEERYFVHTFLLVCQLSYSNDEEGTKVVFERTYQVALPTEADNLLNADKLHEYIQQAFTTVIKSFTNEYLEIVHEYQQNLESLVEAENVPQE